MWLFNPGRSRPGERSSERYRTGSLRRSGGRSSLLAACAGVLALSLLLAACSGGERGTSAPDPTEPVAVTPTVAPTQTPEPTPTSPPVPTATAVPVATAIPVPATPAPTATTAPTPTTPATSTPLPTPTPTPVPQPAELFVEVSEPRDNSVVGSAEVTVAGRSAPDATVSVNGQVADIDASGRFSSAEPVTLMEGPNLIEVIASDLAGGIETMVLTVVYIP
jgi:hypothetical protein